MKTLIRKELLELGVLFGIPFIGLCAIWFGTHEFEDVLLAPRSEPLILVIVPALCSGVLVALVQFMAERWRGTASYALHRGTGALGCFRAKAVAGILCSLLLAIGPPVVFAIGHALFGRNGAIVQWGRVVEIAIFGTFGATAYAVAALAAQLRRGIVVDVLLACFGACGLFVLLFFSSVSLSLLGGASGLGYVAINFLLSWALLRIGAGVFVRSVDPDIAIPKPSHAAILALGLFALLPMASLLISAGQTELRTSVLRGYPSIVRERSSGEIRAELRDDVWKRMTPQIVTTTDSVGRIIRNNMSLGTSDPELDELFHPVYKPIATPRENRDDELSTARRPRFPAHWDSVSSWMPVPYRSALGAFGVRIYIDPDRGALRLFAYFSSSPRGLDLQHEQRWMPPSVPCEVIVEKPGGAGHFSALTRQVGVRGAVCLVDPADGTMWRLDAEHLDWSNPLSEVRLPDGDRFAGFEVLFNRQAALHDRVQSLFPFVRGERGVYLWDGTAFRLRDTSGDAEHVTLEEAQGLAERRVVVTEDDSLAMDVEVRDAKNGTVLFARRFAPSTAQEMRRTALLHAIAAFGSPVGNTLSFLGGPGRVPSRINLVLPREPLLVGRSRPGLLVASLAVSVLLVADALRRQRRRGAGSLLVASSAILIALFGLPAWMLVRALEPRKAAQAVPEPRVAEQAVVLIQSA